MHLAADTVAHNIFVPVKVLTTATAGKIGHAYWEFRFEKSVGEQTWADLSSLMDKDFSRENHLLEKCINRSPLPFQLNWWYIRGLVRLSTVDQWKRFIELVDQFSRFELSANERHAYHNLCMKRMRRCVDDRHSDKVLSRDPTGGDRIQSMTELHRELQEMIARGEVDEQIYDDILARGYPELMDELEKAN